MSNKSTPAQTQRLTTVRRDGVSDATIMSVGAVVTRGLMTWHGKGWPAILR